MQILALGDCNTHTANPAQGTVPDGLAWAFAQQGQPSKITNLGGGMETCREGLARLLNTPTSADIAVINYGLVDAWTTCVPQFYVPYYPDNSLRKISRKALKFTKRHLLNSQLRKFLSKGAVVGESEFSARIGQMITTLRQRSPEVKVFIWGTVLVSNHDSRNVPLCRYNELLSEIALQSNAAFIDSEQIVNHIPIDERHLDGVHLSKTVARLIGTEICLQHAKLDTNSKRVA